MTENKKIEKIEKIEKVDDEGVEEIKIKPKAKAKIINRQKLIAEKKLFIVDFGYSFKIDEKGTYINKLKAKAAYEAATKILAEISKDIETEAARFAAQAIKNGDSANEKKKPKVVVSKKLSESADLVKKKISFKGKILVDIHHQTYLKPLAVATIEDIITRKLPEDFAQEISVTEINGKSTAKNNYYKGI